MFSKGIHLALQRHWVFTEETVSPNSQQKYWQRGHGPNLQMLSAQKCAMHNAGMLLKTILNLTNYSWT